MDAINTLRATIRVLLAAIFGMQMYFCSSLNVQRPYQMCLFDSDLLLENNYCWTLLVTVLQGQT